jgi:hypothetical protein
MNDAGNVEAMRELLKRLKAVGGDDWHKKLAEEMEANEREAMHEATRKSSGSYSRSQRD